MSTPDDSPEQAAAPARQRAAPAAYGVRLTGTHRDLAALRALAEGPDALLNAPCVALSTPATPGAVLTTRALDADAAQRLRARGVDVVRVKRFARAATVTAIWGDVAERYEPLAARECPSLAQALAPVRVPGDPACAEALFLVPREGDVALKTLERLLSLGRDDFTVTEADVAPEGPCLLVRVSAPPAYLLMRARDEPAEGIVAFARSGADEGLWVEWSWEQPLARHAARLAAPEGCGALLARDGRWRTFPAPLSSRTVYDAIAPRVEAPERLDLVPVAGEARFDIRLRLAPAPVLDPEVWLLDQGQFLALESLVESLSQDELSRFTVARTEGPDGVCYVLREDVRPGRSRLGSRVSDVAGSPGFARAVGTDNLYLPPGRDFAPRMRRDELRSFFGLDLARLVVVAEGPAGPRVLTAAALDEVPLSGWVDYVATDRHTELERLEEATVFDWPDLKVERPVVARAAARPEERDDRPKPPRVRREPVAQTAEEPEVVAAAPESDAALATLRGEIRALEESLSAGGHADPSTWRELAWRKAKVGEVEDAAACLESAMFFGETSAEAVSALVAHRGRHVQHGAAPGELAALLSRERLSAAETSWLAAAMVASALRGADVGDDLYQGAARRFSDPAAPVSRRMAWVVCRAVLGRTGDRLGLTRARERLLGGVNERGLSDQLDIPRFVRFTLAQHADDRDASRARLDQIAALEALHASAHVASARGLASLPAYLDSVFAVGFARLGAGGRGHDLLAPIGDGAELGAPNQALLRLYQSRYAHAATEAGDDSWKLEVDAALGAVKEPRVKDRVEWLRKRSEWLRTGSSDAVGAAAKQTVEHALADAEAHPETAPAVLASLMDDRQLFDFEARIVGQRMLRAGVRSGNDELLGEILRAARGRMSRLSHPGQQAEFIGECLRAAAVLRDAVGVDELLDAVVSLANAPNAPAIRDLLAAVTPGLVALRRLGAGESTRRFLEALVPSAARGQREGIRLRAALAEGFLLLRDAARADTLLDEALHDALADGLDHVGRFEAGAAVLSALRHWPTAGRAPRCLRIFEALPRFTDSFTATTSGVYETHKILIAERCVDALADDVTLADDRAHAWLAEEEQSTRRKILADWRDACGR